jgi:hypothetical protein
VRWETSDDQGRRSSVLETLLDAGGERYTLELLSFAPGEPGLRVEQAQRHSERGFAHTMPAARAERSEVLQVEGRPRTCVVWYDAWTERGVDCEEWTWIDEQHGLPLRSRSRRGNTTLELDAVELAAALVVAQREIECVRYEGTLESGPFHGSLEEWRSLEVPGGVVQRVRRAGPGAGEGVVTSRVLRFEGRRHE